MDRNSLINIRQKRYQDFCAFMKSRGYTSPDAIRRFQASMVMSALTYIATLVVAYLLALMVMPGHELLAKAILITLALWVLASKWVSYRWAQAFMENNYVK